MSVPPIRGFTLLELVLVMVIVCIALAAVAPSLGGWSRASRLRDAAEQVLAATRWAQTQAVADAQVYRLNVDTAKGRYWVTALSGQDFVNIEAEFGRGFTVPQGTALEMKTEQGVSMPTVDFFPDGRTQPARIRLSATAVGSVEVQCLSPGEGFRLIEQQEQTR